MAWHSYRYKFRLLYVYVYESYILQYALVTFSELKTFRQTLLFSSTDLIHPHICQDISRQRTWFTPRLSHYTRLEDPLHVLQRCSTCRSPSRSSQWCSTCRSPSYSSRCRSWPAPSYCTDSSLPQYLKSTFISLLYTLILTLSYSHFLVALASLVRSSLRFWQTLPFSNGDVPVACSLHTS